jgi:DNA repair photolyase
MKLKQPIIEKRRFIRSKFIVPVELETRDRDGNAQKIIGAEAVNISEKGVKLTSNEPLDPSHTVKVNLNLPPCYSGDPKKAKGIEAEAKVIWSRSFTQKNKVSCGLQLLDVKEEDAEILKGIIRYETEKSTQASFLTLRPKVEIKREPHSCNMYAVDLTIGCENECKYCHFSKLNQERWLKRYPLCKDFPIPVDLSPIYEMEHLPESVVYLSPSSDAFTPQARELTHELLSFMLPKGVIFTISTKCIIPDKTIGLLKRYHHLIEGIAMGITNLDDERNKLLESTCPMAKERLEHIRQLKEIGCKIGVRMDPLFPLIDDTDENLNSTIKEIAKAGAVHISGTYFFSFGRFLKELRKIPRLKESLRMMKEKTYPVGGVALSPSLEYKKTTYEKMNEICKQYGINFATCGCKEIRLREEKYSLICRNLDYYTNRVEKR